jgi:hypothetical protein
MSPLTWEVRFLTLPAWLGLGARPSLKIDRATIKHFESREPISPERRIGWASISIARFFPMAHLPDGGQPWETKSSSAVSTSGACLANAKNQLTLSIMNRSVQYAISRDSIQGGVNLSVHYGIMEIWGAQRTLVEKEHWRRHYSGTFILNDGICVSNRRVQFLLADAALARCILNRAVHPNI